MTELPDRAGTAACRVIKACTALAWGEKAVWLEDQWLDRTSEGSWISAANLADRLGMAPESVEQYRRRLHQMGLSIKIARPGARTDGWRPQLPEGCCPAERSTPDEIRRCVVLLDGLLLASHARRQARGTGSRRRKAAQLLAHQVEQTLGANPNNCSGEAGAPADDGPEHAGEQLFGGDPNNCIAPFTIENRIENGERGSGRLEGSRQGTLRPPGERGAPEGGVSAYADEKPKGRRGLRRNTGGPVAIAEPLADRIRDLFADAPDEAQAIAARWIARGRPTPAPPTEAPP